MLLGDMPDAIISCGGGELMCEILRYVDFERIAQAKPKWFMGYSDNTNLTFLLTTRSPHSVTRRRFTAPAQHPSG